VLEHINNFIIIYIQILSKVSQTINNPEIIRLTQEQLNWVVKLQGDYNMWRGGKLYLPRFEMLMEEIGDYIK